MTELKDEARMVRMSPYFQNDADRLAFIELADEMMKDDDIGVSYHGLLGIGKLFFDLGKGIDIWD